MHALLTLLASDAAQSARITPRGLPLAECVLAGTGYELSIYCRNRGIRPFLADMRRPWPRKHYLGRLYRDGTGHVFEHGLRVFFNLLLEEGVLSAFIDDLASAVAHYAAHAARSAGGPIFGPGPACPLHRPALVQH
jgi:hypothetical protein